MTRATPPRTASRSGPLKLPAALAAGFAVATAAVAWALWVRSVVPSGSPTDCGGCHEAVAENWSQSRHAVASTNPTFRVSFRNSGHPWCLTCHAASDGALNGPGVGCSACHLDADGVLRGTAPSLRARLAHPIADAATLSDERLCATCHQFAFPTRSALDASVQTGIPLHFTETPTQDTVDEWRQSHAATAGRTCTSCHDPHRAPGGHDTALLRATLSADVRYEPENERVLVTLTATGAAHAVPTGDPFRRLYLTVCDAERCDPPHAERILQRKPQSEGNGWVVRADTRIGPATGPDGTASTSFALPIYSPLPPGARYRLFYHYADPIHEHLLPHEEVRSLVAEGQIVPGDREPL